YLSRRIGHPNHSSHTSHTGNGRPSCVRARWTKLPNDRNAEGTSRGGGPMAGAMRKMGIYLGLVEDDDARAYGRYDARQSEHPDSDRRYGRHEDGRYATDYVDDGFADDPYADDRYAATQASTPASPHASSRDRFGAGYADAVQ